MRSVDKGAAPGNYSRYRDAMPDLVDRIGCYCSYCELPIPNEPDVEHVQPKSRGGSPTQWSNLLLGCKKCNKIKSNKNPGRGDHLWPDEDNTTVAYAYRNEILVEPAAHLIAPVRDYARKTLELTGIDRVPSRIARPTKKDKKDFRWQKRREAWGKAERAVANWNRIPVQEMADQIAETAASTGFYSIWRHFFQDKPMVMAAIDRSFPGTYHPVPATAGGGYAVRPGGRY